MISRAWRHLHFTLCELRVRVCVWHIVRHSQQTATEKLNSCLSATFVDLTVIILFFFLHVYKLKLQGIVVLWLNTLSNICQSIKKNYRSLEGPVGNCFVLFSGDSRFLMCETEWIYFFFLVKYLSCLIFLQLKGAYGIMITLHYKLSDGNAGFNVKDLVDL